MTTKTSAEHAAPLATPTEVRRPQIGGFVGDVDPVTQARFARALGHAALLLTVPQRRFVADLDACRVDGRELGAAELEALARSGRLGEVEGAFVLAWFDGNRLHLARDAPGGRTLFYAAIRGGVAFASTLRPLLDGGLVPRTLNTGALPAYLTYGYLPGRETLVDRVLELLPGEHLVVAGEDVRHELLWTLPPEDREPAEPPTYELRLRRQLEATVRASLPLSGPVAVTLSGGLDSSAVTALAARLHHERVSTFSLAFGPGIENELAFSGAVAAHCGTDHHVVELSSRTVMSRFDDTMAALSTPIGEPLTVGNSILFAAAAERAPVVLNGEGGDPCFGGPKNVPMLLSELYGPGGAGTAMRQHLARSYLVAHRKCFGELDRILEPEVIAAAALETGVAPHLSDPRWTSLVNRLMAMNVTFKGAHHILPKVEQLSRPHGVLPRSPLFARPIVDLAMRMPAPVKQQGHLEKIVLKRAVADLLPAHVVERRKSGMRVPVETWLNGSFDRFARERVLDGLAPHGIFRRDYLEELARPDPAFPAPRRGAKLWLLLSLESWLRVVLAAPTATP